MSVEQVGEPVLPEFVVTALREVGIDEPRRDDPLHYALANAIGRLGAGASKGEQFVAMAWHFTNDEERVGDDAAAAEAEYVKLRAVRSLELGEEAALAKDEYELLLSAEIVKARGEGERNADVAARRASLDASVRTAQRKARSAEQRAKNVDADPDVAMARLRMEGSKAARSVARARAWNISNQIKVWQSTNANQRAADRAHTQGVGGAA